MALLPVEMRTGMKGSDGGAPPIYAWTNTERTQYIGQLLLDLLD